MKLRIQNRNLQIVLRASIGRETSTKPIKVIVKQWFKPSEKVRKISKRSSVEIVDFWCQTRRKNLGKFVGYIEFLNNDNKTSAT